MKEFSDKGIEFTIIKVNNSCNLMINVMEQNYNINGKFLNITDLSQACLKKSQAEVTKEFVTATSFIMSKAVGKAFGAGESKGTKGKAAPKSDPLWDTKKFELG